MKKFFVEFKEFISRGNVMDMAVGVIVGGAFKAIADSLTADIIMPIIGILSAKILLRPKPHRGDRRHYIWKFHSGCAQFPSLWPLSYSVWSRVSTASIAKRKRRPPLPRHPPSPLRKKSS